MSSQPLITEFDDNVVDLTRRQGVKLAERLMEICSLYTLSKQLSVTLDVDEVFHEAEKILRESLGVDHFSIMLLNSEADTLSIWKANGAIMSAAAAVTFKLGEGVCGVVAQTGKPELVPDVAKDSRFLNYKTPELIIGSFFATPLLGKDGRVMGVFNVHKPEPDTITLAETPIFNAAARHIALALENSLLFQSARQMAITDDLTGLYTRRYFIETLNKEISATQRTGAPLSLVMMDLDYFKSVNDIHGHGAGDEALRRMGAILHSHVRKGDTCVRYGGEEFALLAPGAGLEEAVAIAEKLRRAVETGLRLPAEYDSAYSLTLSAGVASYAGAKGTAGDLIKEADLQLLKAKESGKNRVCHPSPEGDPRGGGSGRNEKRASPRAAVRLGVSRREYGVRMVDMLVDGKWVICAIDDIGKEGFRGFVEFEPRVGQCYTCRAVLAPAAEKEKVFAANCAWSERVFEGRYLLGVKVDALQPGWAEAMRLIHQ